MTRRLRIRLILTTVLCAAVLLGIAGVMIYCFTASNLQHEREARMQTLCSQETAFVPSYYVASLQEDGTVVTLYSEGMQQIAGGHVLHEAVARALAQEDASGFLPDSDLAYYKNGERIVLMDGSDDLRTLAQLSCLLWFAGAGILVFLTLASILISRWIVSPIETSLLQQKQLIADVSHELKTPLAIIDASADLMDPASDVSEQSREKWLGYIHAEVDHMSELLSDLLVLARSDESQSESAGKTLNLSDTAYEVTLPFESICYEKERTLTIDIRPDIWIQGQEKGIRQLIGILLDNAIKYSDAHASLHFCVKEHAEKVILSMQNTGEPIAKEDLPHLFDRFYRARQADGSRQGGSGLGLSIAQKIVSENNGKISVESDRENGTVFTCIFRKAKAPKA